MNGQLRPAVPGSTQSTAAVHIVQNTMYKTQHTHSCISACPCDAQKIKPDKLETPFNSKV